MKSKNEVDDKFKSEKRELMQRQKIKKGRLFRQPFLILFR